MHAESLWVLKHASFDQMGNRIEINRRGSAAESQGFEWNRAASREAIEHVRRRVRVCVSNELTQRVDQRRLRDILEYGGARDGSEYLSPVVLIARRRE